MMIFQNKLIKFKKLVKIKVLWFKKMKLLTILISL